MKRSNFALKSEETCQVFKDRGYPPDSDVNTELDRAQQIDQQTALQTSQGFKKEGMTFTLTYHPCY